jgi:hypothetical protein
LVSLFIFFPTKFDDALKKMEQLKLDHKSTLEKKYDGTYEPN